MAVANRITHVRCVLQLNERASPQAFLHNRLHNRSFAPPKIFFFFFFLISLIKNVKKKKGASLRHRESVY